MKKTEIVHGIAVPGPSEPFSTEIQKQKNIVWAKSIDKVLYILKFVKCGKKSCKTCPHGPYFYARIRHKNQVSECYIGKTFMTLREKNMIRRQKKEEKKDE